MTVPQTVVFQTEQPAATTSVVPDQDAVIVGPSNQILDYTVTSTDTAITASYGIPVNSNNSEIPNLPPVNTVAITVSEPPNILPGAWVNPSSVRMFFRDFRAIMASGTTADVTLDTNTVIDAGATFVTDGVQAGDVLIINDPGGGGTDLVRTVSAVTSETELTVTDNFVATDTGLTWRVERQVASDEVDAQYIRLPIFKDSNQVQLEGGVEIAVGGANRVVSFANVHMGYTATRTDLQTLDSVSSPAEILVKIGPIDARNPLAVGCSVALANSGTSRILFYGTTGTTFQDFESARSRLSNEEDGYAFALLYDEDISTPLAWRNMFVNQADPNLALENGTTQRFRTVIAATQLPVEEDIAEETPTATAEQTVGQTPVGFKEWDVTGLDTIAALVVPGDQVVITASNTTPSIDGTYTIGQCESATEFVTNEDVGVEVLAATGVNIQILDGQTLAVKYDDTDNQATASSEDVDYTALLAGTTPPTLTKTQDAIVGVEIDEVAGVSTVIRADYAGGITAQEVVDALAVSINFSASTVVPATAQTAGAVVLAGGADPLAEITTAHDVYSTLFDAAASFITSGVIPGDTLEIPEDPNGAFPAAGGAVQTYTVDTVISEQRLTIVNAVGGQPQTNTSTQVYELPHGVKRIGGALVTQGTVNYRIRRDLTSSQQVTSLVAQAQSLNSRRAILTWSDSCDVTGLTDGSLPLDTNGNPSPAGPQPGYYLSCATAGLTAGNPAHQGFSRFAIAGIDRIRNSKDIFSEEEIAMLSDGGLYVYVQRDVTAAPFCLHQLTTDPSTLTTGEYSVARNFDFVSDFLRIRMEPFIGVWNINNDTIGFIFENLRQGLEQLRSRTVARIGAPINPGSRVVAVEETSFGDRLAAYVDVNLPKPLNNILLHVVSTDG